MVSIMAKNKRYEHLTAKQMAFVRAFIELGSKADAYRRAYNCGRMSGKVINQKAYELSVNPEVRTKIQELQAETRQRNRVSTDRVIQEYLEIAYLDPGQFFQITAMGEMSIDWEALRRSGSRAIKSITQDEYLEAHGDGARTVRRTRVTFHDKLGALRDLARHLGLFPKDGALPLAERYQIILNLKGKGNDRVHPKKAPKKINRRLS